MPHHFWRFLVTGLICVIGFGSYAHGQGDAGCLYNVERTLREAQARAKKMTDKEMDWPPCCPDSKASRYPQDGYYRDALRNNPDLGPDIVRALRDGLLYTAPFFGSYYQAESVGDFLGLTPGQMDLLKISSASIDPEFPGDATPITLANYCEEFEKLALLIRKMQFVDLQECQRTWVGPEDAVCNARGANSSSDFAAVTDCSDPCCIQSAWAAGTGDDWWCSTSLAGSWSAAEAHARAMFNRQWAPGGPFPMFRQMATSSTDCAPDYSVSVELEQVRGRLKIDLQQERGSVVSIMSAYSEPVAGCDPEETTPGGHPFEPDQLDGKMHDTGLTQQSAGVWYSPLYGGGDYGVIQPYSGSGPVGCNDLPNVGSLTRGWAVQTAKPMLSPELDKRPEYRDCGGDCTSCIPGQPMPDLANTSGYFPLGRLLNGEPAGYLYLRDFDAIEGLCLPEHLIANVDTDDVDLLWVYQDVGACPPLPNLPPTAPATTALRKVLRQLNTGRYIVDIVPGACEPAGNQCGFQIHFYLRENMSEELVDGLYDVEGPAFASSCIIREQGVTVPDPRNLASTTTGDRITLKATGAGAGLWQFVRVANGAHSDWMLRSGINSSGVPTTIEVKLTDTLTNGDLKETRILSDASGNVALRRYETRHEFAWGTEIIEEGIGASGQELISTREFYDDTIVATTSPSYGKLMREFSATGHWKVYHYDSRGRLSKVVSQHKSNAATTTESQNRVDEWTYITNLNVIGSSATDLVEIHTEKLLGYNVSRTYTVHGFDAVSNTRREVWTIRCKNPAAPSSEATFIGQVVSDPGSLDWLVTRSWSDPETIPGTSFTTYRHVKSISPDGTLSLTERTNSGGVVTTESVSGPGNSTMTGVLGGTMTVSTRQPTGVLSSTESFEWDGTDWIQIGGMMSDPEDDDDVDAFGRILRRHHFDGTVTTSVYGCCHLESETDGEGILTTYTYDLLGRTTAVARKVSASASITTHSEYDAAGRVVHSWRTGTDSSVIDLGSTEYDQAGRVTMTEDALENQTTYSYGITSGLVYQETILPAVTGETTTVNIVQWSYRDGSPSHVNGTGTHPTAHDSGVEMVTTPGATTAIPMRVSKQSVGTAGTQWVKTYVNGLGQSVCTAYPGTSSVYAWSIYDKRGHLVQQIDPDGYIALHAQGYGTVNVPSGAPGASQGVDWDGRWSLSVQDGDQDGVIDFDGTDRITMTRSYLVERSSAPFSTGDEIVRRSETRVWTTDSDWDATYLVATQDQSLDGRRSWSEADGKVTTSQTLITPSTATRSTTTILPNGVSSLSLSEYGRDVGSESTGPSSEFLRATTTSYDPHGRVSGTTFIADETNSALNATTTFTYDALDRTLTQTDPEPNTASPYVGQRVTTYTYDQRGRVTNVNHGTGKDTVTKYFPTGEVKEVSGFGANPVRYVYDDHGRLSELHTFKTGPTTPGGTSGWAGEAVTTWNYDAARGWLTSKDYADNTETTYEYTAGGRLAERTAPRTSSTTVTTTYGYTAFGELESVDYSDVTQDVELAYDRRGRLKTLIDAAGERSMSYDDAGRTLLETIAAHSGSIEDHLAGVRVDNHYDSTGRRDKLTTSIGANGTVPASPSLAAHSTFVDYGYDSQWRIAHLIKNNVKVAYQYHDPTGQVGTTEYRDNANSNALKAAGDRSFDKLGRLTGIRWNDAGSDMIAWYDYTYDKWGRRTQRTDAKSDLTLRWAYEYDDLGQLTSAKRLFDEPCSGNPGPYMPGEYFGYSYDDIGNRTGVEEGGDTEGDDTYTSGYTSNDLNQYTERAVSRNIEVAGVGSLFPSDTQAFTVNASTAWKCHGLFHKRVEGSDNSTSPSLTQIDIAEIPGQPPFSYNVFLPETPETFSYDLSGNLTQDGIWDYEWDAENRLTAMSMRPEVAIVALGTNNYWVRLEFGYDWLGRRISKRFMKGSSDPVEIIESNGKQLALFGTMWCEKYVYEPGSWNVSMSYYADIDTEEFIGPCQSFAWGPDLSGGLGGAGGIGGLAVYADDDGSSPAAGPGTGVGMVPLYDGNGNILRLHTVDFTPGDSVMASYEYGPFGELRAMNGVQGHRNPMRWSTKWTDAETGLVYYGYRYYAATVGRWLNRDRIGESDGPALSTFIGNGAPNFVDALGLRKVRLEFDAFISGFRGAVLSEPFHGDFLGIGFGTDDRLHGQLIWNDGSRPNARLATRVDFDTQDVGALRQNRPVIVTQTGVSTRYIWTSSLVWKLDATKVSTPSQQVSIIDNQFDALAPDEWNAHKWCKSRISVKARAAYPFLKIAPAIDYEWIIYLMVARDGAVTVWQDGKHDFFPDYESYVDGDLLWTWSSPDPGPTLSNLNARSDRIPQIGTSILGDTRDECQCMTRSGRPVSPRNR
ncbi:MAG: RHS repeat-associated core domain-containing protein [Phycisphaerales bacterium]|nr:RHS repeat-associated core domain-containing protein [Phycisphaerales bacterium]